MAARQNTAEKAAAEVKELRQSADASDDVAELRAQIDTIRTDISALASLMGEIGERRKDEAARQVHDKVDELKERAETMGDQARDQIDAAGAKMREQLHEQPGMTLAVATGMGFLAGLLLARR